MNFANLLNHLMLSYNVHKRLLCFKTRIGKPTINRYLRGETVPNDENVRLIAEAFWSYSDKSQNPHELKLLLFLIKKMIQFDKTKKVEPDNG